MCASVSQQNTTARAPPHGTRRAAGRAPAAGRRCAARALHRRGARPWHQPSRGRARALAARCSSVRVHPHHEHRRRLRGCVRALPRCLRTRTGKRSAREHRTSMHRWRCVPTYAAIFADAVAPLGPRGGAATRCRLTCRRWRWTRPTSAQPSPATCRRARCLASVSAMPVMPFFMPSRTLHTTPGGPLPRRGGARSARGARQRGGDVLRHLPRRSVRAAVHQRIQGCVAVSSCMCSRVCCVRARSCAARKAAAARWTRLWKKTASDAPFSLSSLNSRSLCFVRRRRRRRRPERGAGHVRHLAAAQPQPARRAARCVRGAAITFLHSLARCSP